jgi:RNA polymerase sigma-54 factor
MRLGLEQMLRQELRLTPQLILQMKLLQVSTIELEQLIEAELQENPALERADDQSEQPGPTEAPEVQPAPSESATADAQSAEPALPEGDANFDVKPGEEYSVADLLPEEGATMPLPSSGSESQESAVELAVGPESSLHDALMPRLRATLNDEDADLAEFIIDSLNEDGFLTMTEEEIAQSQEMELERVKAVLFAVQRLEPGGIGCRDARESFLVQLEMAGYDPASLERKLLNDYWDLLMKKQTAKVARLCGVSEEDVRAAIGTILRLEPRPARRFAGGAPAYVTPDFSVEWRGDRLVVVPNDETFPRLRLSRRYVDMLRDPKAFPKDQVEFAKQKFQRALMFLRGIESRRKTLHKLVEIVVEEQRGFFTHGREHLKPATLRQAADRLGVHASTVSRAIAGKYVETTYGIFALSYFFKAGSGDKSRTSIKGRIQAIVDAEDKSCPLSDDDICTKLKAEGIEISRRTVAKYRAELSIAGAADRKGF